MSTTVPKLLYRSTRPNLKRSRSLERACANVPLRARRLSLSGRCRSEFELKSVHTRLGERLAKMSVELTENEQKIRDLLVQASAAIDAAEPARSADLELRLTGGWVRDKLLGLDSHDLDIAINRMTGYEFATRLTEYIAAHAGELGIQPKSIHKIDMNPEKSKHLETTTTKLYESDIDFVNLRSEEYTETSRIPTMRFGTPAEDALRRDATINALFYNLQSQQVEDFTGRGLEDLRAGLIRTPLGAFETFRDDPLRVLRLIRFAARFGFRIAPDVLEAMAADEIKDALRVKISRERIGVELEKTLLDANPSLGLALVERTGLYDAIFGLPAENCAPQTRRGESNLPASVPVARWVPTAAPALAAACAGDVDGRPATFYVWLFAALGPWKGSKCTIGKGKETDAVFAIVRDGVKLSTAVSEHARKVVNSTDGVDEAVWAVPRTAWTRQYLGGRVREWGPIWKVSVVCALVARLAADSANLRAAVAAAPTPLEQFHVDLIPCDVDPAAPGLAETVAGYVALLERVAALGLDEAWALKPLVNGKEIAAALKLKPGKWMAEILRDVVDWQLENPEGTKEACLEHVHTNLLHKIK
ncbi:phosphatase [Dipodascopsis tothii]|uniref:phosphatase n=1 Tax=Dipodascopsis tothii TaxID=44089 RepID=UPI0034CD392A